MSGAHGPDTAVRVHIESAQVATIAVLRGHAPYRPQDGNKMACTASTAFKVDCSDHVRARNGIDLRKGQYGTVRYDIRGFFV